MFWSTKMEVKQGESRVRRKFNFYEKYTNYCKLKIVRPLPLPQKNVQKYFEICGDRIDASNWLAIIDSLAYDQSLVTVAIKLKKAIQAPVARINSLNKLRKIPCQVPIATAILFGGLVRSISQSLSVSNCLTSLALEGLPLLSVFTHQLLEGLSQNHSIERMSFDRSALGDEGFEAVCSTIKYLPNIDSLSACQCNLTHKSCEALAALITAQCVYRFSEGWMHSLRYRAVDVKSIRGIKRIALNGNGLIGDKGVRRIIDALIDDEWIEAVQLRECGLTNDSADLIMKYLNKVGSRVIFDVTRNKHLSKYCAEEILANVEDHHSSTLSNKEMIMKLKEENECLRSQLSTEKLNRMRSDELNVQLKRELLKEPNEPSKTEVSQIPEGFVLLPKDSLVTIHARDKLAKEIQKNARSRRTKATKSIYTMSKKTLRSRKFSNGPEIVGDAKPSKKWKTLSEKSANDARTIFFGSSDTPSVDDSDSNSSDSESDVIG